MTLECRQKAIQNLVYTATSIIKGHNKHVRSYLILHKNMLESIRDGVVTDSIIKNSVYMMLATLAVEFGALHEPRDYIFAPLASSSMAEILRLLSSEKPVADELLTHLFLILREAVVYQGYKVSEGDGDIIAHSIIYRLSNHAPWAPEDMVLIAEPILVLLVDRSETIFSRILADKIIAAISIVKGPDVQDEMPFYVKRACLELTLNMLLDKPSLGLQLMGLGFLDITDK